jgi:hypothetical protein
VAKLEDIQARAPLKKTGVERRTPTDEERRLIQQVNEAKRRFGVVTTDPARQLKSALDAIKTRLTHQIADLGHQIATGTKTVRDKTRTAYDAEANKLKAERDLLKRQFDAIFGNPELTPEQRLAMAMRTVEGQIGIYEARIKSGDVSPLRGESKVPKSAALEALKARRAALKAEWEELRDLSDPGRRERLELSSLKARMTAATARYQERLAAGDFSARPKKVYTLDAEALKLKAKLEMAKQEFQRGVELERLKNRSHVQRTYDTLKEALNLPRAVLASWDMSALLRQGGFITLGNPVRGLKSLPAGFKALFSGEKAEQVMQEILLRPNAPLYARAKLYLAPLEGGRLSGMEEAFMSRLAHRIPGLAQSNRAYVTVLNRLRADTFDAMAKSLERGGELKPEELQALGNFINVSTGRGNLGKAAMAAETMATVFFAPRLVVSRFQLLAGQPFYGGNARTRAAIAKEYGKFLGGLAAVYGLSQLAGATVEDDPRSSDFGKLRFGNTRVDPLAGLSQASVLTSRLVTGEKVSGNGKVRSIRGDNLPYGADTSADVAGRFLRSKFSPVVGAAVNVASGSDVVGRPVTAASTAKGLLVPLTFQDVYQAMLDQGVPKGTALGILSLFGWGLQVQDRP